MTERPVHAFSRIIIIIYPNLGSLSVHKSLVTIESSSIINNFTSDNLFLKSTLDLSFKPSNFVPGLIPRPEWMVVLFIFTNDFTVGPSKKM